MLKNRFLFPLNLQYFSADTGGGAGEGTGEENPDTNNNGTNQDQNGQGSKDNQEKFIPKTRFDEVNNKYKELKAQLEEINKQKEQEELEAQKKRGEFEELYNNATQELENYKTQAESASQRVEQLEGIIQTLVDQELASVPEELRDLVPSDYTPEQKLTWITQAKAKGLFGTQKNEKEEKELGGATNKQQDSKPDIANMSIAELFRSAYGKK